MLSTSPALPNFEDSHRSPLLPLGGSCDVIQKCTIAWTPGEPWSFRIRSGKLGCGGVVRGRSVQHLIDPFLLFSFCVFQVYVSYDYGKSFSRISGKLNFGVGNNSEAVISQFYHSPADNKRVRRASGFRTLHSGKMAARKGAGPWSPLPWL